MKTRNKIALGLAGGLLAGTAVGLMVAPQTGKESRELVNSKASKLGQRMKNLRCRDEESVNHYAEVVG